VQANFSFPGLDSFPNLQFNDLGQLQVGPDGNAPQSAIQKYVSVGGSDYVDEERAIP